MTPPAPSRLVLILGSIAAFGPLSIDMYLPAFPAMARDLSGVSANAEAHEVFEVHWVPFAKALAQARTGEITDAKTLAGLFRASKG